MDDEERWIEDEPVTLEQDEEENPSGFDLFSTDKKDPNDEFHLNLGSITISLTGIKARYPHLLQSTGMTLWKGSEKLCQFLFDEPGIVRGKNVVELGAGLGLCGIVAHKQGAKQVILTDGDTDTLKNMRRNVAANIDIESDSDVTNKVMCKQLLWGKNIDAFCEKWAPEQRFDIVMGGDIAYAQESLDILFETALGLLSPKPDSLFILSYVFRGGVTVSSIEACAQRNKLCWENIGDGGLETLFLFRRNADIIRDSSRP